VAARAPDFGDDLRGARWGRPSLGPSGGQEDDFGCH
jgi:hypothetical protein